MAAEKQGPYPPMDQPPAYPGPATSAVGPPLQGFAPPPGQAPPPGAYPHGQVPPPGAYPPGQPMAHPGYVQPGMPHAPPGTYVAGQPIAVQPGVAITQPVVVVNQQFRQSPVNTVCPHCSQNIITSTTAEPGGLTWLLCAGICLFGFWLGCCLIPFCIPDLQDIRHSCPNCKNTLYVYRRM